MSSILPALSSRTAHLHLCRIEDLFSPPSHDPLTHGPTLPLSGLEQLVNLRKKSVRATFDKVLIEIDEPPSPSRVSFSDVPRLWRRQMSVLAAGAREERSQIRRSGLRLLLIGALATTITVALATAIGQAQPFHPAVNSGLSDGLTILAWVILWRPLEMLLFDAGAPGRQSRIYEAFAELDIEVTVGKREPSAASAASAG